MNDIIHKKNERAGAEKLREASRAYYQEDREIMSNSGVRRTVRSLWSALEKGNRDRSGRQSNR